MCADVTYEITYPHRQQSSNLRPVSEGGVLFSRSLCTFFLKREQKLCPNLLIKKKRIAQLINGKLDKNRYNKLQADNLNKQDNQQAHSTYHNRKLEHHATKKTHWTYLINRIRSINQADAESFHVMTLFFLLILRDFSTFLITSSEAFSAKTEAISMLYSGQAVSKRRASELGANTPASVERVARDWQGPDDGGEGAEVTEVMLWKHWQKC
jgi:hypothetical protein